MVRGYAYSAIATESPSGVDSGVMSDDVHPEMLDRWLVRGAVAAVVALQFSLIHDFGYGTRWLAPVVELIVLVPLTALTLRAERLAWDAHTSQQWKSANSTAGSTSRLEWSSSSSSASPTRDRSCC